MESKSQKKLPLCVICSGLLWNPRICRQCQRTFCQKCLESPQFSLIKNCPKNTEGAPCTIVCSLINYQIILDDLKISCKFHDKGCPKYLNITKLEKHENACEYMEEKCTTCYNFFNFKDMLEHKKNCGISNQSSSISPSEKAPEKPLVIDEKVKIYESEQIHKLKKIAKDHNQLAQEMTELKSKIINSQEYKQAQENSSPLNSLPQINNPLKDLDLLEDDLALLSASFSDVNEKVKKNTEVFKTLLTTLQGLRTNRDYLNHIISEQGTKILELSKILTDTKDTCLKYILDVEELKQNTRGGRNLRWNWLEYTGANQQANISLTLAKIHIGTPKPKDIKKFEQLSLSL